MARNLQSKDFQKKKKVRTWWVSGLIAISVISWVSAFCFFMRLSAFEITKVTVFGADQDIVQALQDATFSGMDGYYLGIFPRDSTLVYPKASMVAELKRSSPRIDDVTIKRDGLHGLMVTVNQKIPAAIVCATLPDFDGDHIAYGKMESCYLADESGFLFEQSPTFSGHAYNVFYQPDMASESSSTDLTGTYATSTAGFLALQSFYDGAKAAGIAPDGILIKAEGEYELYASTTVIYFNEAKHMQAELSNLVAFWKGMSASTTLKGSFDYIDLRYGANVFYKTLGK